MRTLAIIAGVGIVLGVGLAFGINAVRGPAKAPPKLPCTAEWLKFAPTIGLDPTGKIAYLGFTAPGPADCIAQGTARVMTVEVTAADGKRLVRRILRAGPRPGSEVQSAFSGVVAVPALKLCKAPQPLHVWVSVIGVSTSGDTRLHFARGSCALGG